MEERAQYIEPMPRQHRRFAFLLLLALFAIAIPLLYLYATGYRFDFSGRANLVSTGGIFIAVDRTGASIYIDDELVRETRVFRQAFYAQSLNPGTHRVHVQKEGHHTWVKELPVYPHLVTEAQALNLPIVPQARVITPWQTTSGALIVGTSTLAASTTQPVFAGTTTASMRVANSEFASRLALFREPEAATTTAASVPAAQGATNVTTQRPPLSEADAIASSTLEIATTTRESNGVRIYERDGDVFVRWVGSRELMPYYYCAEPFEPYSTSTLTLLNEALEEGEELAANTAELLHPVQTVSDDQDCKPEIRIDRKGQRVSYFTFFPNSPDFVILALEDGIYVVEVDERAWQNVQPLMLGEKLEVRVDGGRIYIYDGTFIYEMILD